MSKKEMISIRITSEQKEICNKLNISYPQIWNAGYDNLIPKKKEELEKLAKKHYDLYIHYNDLYIQFDKEKKQTNKILDEICKYYIDKNRSIDNPSAKDRIWLDNKCRIANLTHNQVLNRCKELISK